MLSESIIRGQQSKSFLDPDKVSFTKGVLAPKIKGLAFSRVKCSKGIWSMSEDKWAYDPLASIMKNMKKSRGVKFDK